MRVDRGEKGIDGVRYSPALEQVALLSRVHSQVIELVPAVRGPDVLVPLRTQREQPPIVTAHPLAGGARLPPERLEELRQGEAAGAMAERIRDEAVALQWLRQDAVRQAADVENGGQQISVLHDLTA